MPTSSVSYDPALNQPQHGSDAWFPRRALCKAGLVAATAALVLLTANGQGGHPPQASTAHVFISPAAARPNAPMVRLARPRHTTQPLRSTRHDAVSRREGLSLAGSVAAWLSGGGQRAEAFGGFGRGLDIPGYQGQSVLIPNAIKNSKVTKALEGFEFPPEYPFLPEDFVRFDESDDGNFYSAPRFVTHIDDEAIASLRTFYKAVFDQAPQGQYNVLDICSSWVSHYPEDFTAKRVSITGMNDAELKANKQATDYSLGDLNKDPTLPYDDSTFDFVTNVVSVDYLIRPQEVVTELHRVMKPGGLVIFSFSNRCFFTKAINMWQMNMNDGPGHCRIVATYFRFSPDNGWKDITCTDVSANPGRSDPMWVVTAVKA